MLNKKIINFIQNKSILITGGTGSFGRCFTEYLIKNKIKFKKLIIYSRDELKQYEMQKMIHHKNLRFFIGDIRDYDRIELALRDVDIVIHAAALKQVPAAEYNPFEYIKTNILGTQNIIRASIEKKVKNVIFLSTDKACSPLNLYGATKLAAEKSVIAAQNTIGKQNIKFSVVRYGNVFNSRGSVIPIFLNNKNNFIPITHKDMTRFMMTLKESVEFVFNSLVNSRGGEIFIPKLYAFKIIDLAKAIEPSKKIKIIGIRPGEKIHEELINFYESKNVIEFKKHYVLTSLEFDNSANNYTNKKIKNNFSYNSHNSKLKLNENDLKKIISKNI